MDVQKERERFEAESFVRDCLEEGVVYCLQENKYKKGCPETLFTAVCFINGAWEAWQAVKADVVECKWTHANDGIYHTDCGNSFILNCDTLEANGMEFCCYCGGKLVEAQEQSND